jgi:hypothetical protein
VKGITALEVRAARAVKHEIGRLRVALAVDNVPIRIPLEPREESIVIILEAADALG